MASKIDLIRMHVHACYMYMHVTCTCMLYIIITPVHWCEGRATDECPPADTVCPRGWRLSAQTGASVRIGRGNTRETS